MYQKLSLKKISKEQALESHMQIIAALKNLIKVDLGASNYTDVINNFKEEAKRSKDLNKKK